MNILLCNFSESVNTAFPEATQRARGAAAAVAFFAATTTPIPAQSTDNMREFYQNIVESVVANQIGFVNEGVVYDVNYALELANKFWQIRVRAAYPTLRRSFVGVPGVVNSLTGYEDIMSQTDRDFLGVFWERIAQLALELEPVFAQLNRQ